MVSASARRERARYAMERGISQRRACALAGLPRSTLDYQYLKPAKDLPLQTKLRELALQHKRYGYRRVAALLRRQGLQVNTKRVYRLWKQQGLSLRLKRKQRRFEPRTKPVPMPCERPNEVWACDFVHERCSNGQQLRCLTVVDEFTRECVVLSVQASQPAQRLVKALRQAMTDFGVPTSIRTDNGPEFLSLALQRFLQLHDIKHIFSQPGKPWQNGKNESFNGKFRDECLDRECFASRKEAQVQSERWRRHDNEERPHSGIDYMTPSEKRLAYQETNAIDPNVVKLT
jgi:putative transposase